ncbi:MAG: P-loop NTPase, partial [Pseudomonadota bacterium]
MSIIEKAVGKLEKEAGFGAKKSLDNAKPHLNQEKVVPADNQMQAAVHIEESKPAISVKTSIDATRSNYIDIDLNRLYQLGIVTPNQGKTQVAEQFRIIKRPILTKALKQRTENGKHGNLIMISSALAAEGKSFCALSLAMSIASEMDNRVLLVDADVARPSIPRILGFGVKKGLLDIL